MTDKITFDLVTPERLMLSTQAEMVTIPGSEGDMGVMAGHMPLISTLRPGIVAVSGAEGGDKRFVVLGGFAEIDAAKLTLLAEEAIPAAEFDTAALDARIAIATDAVTQAKSDAEKASRQQALDGLQQLRAVI
jgi:F-type H+-transporting ATPase subunit epsilon